MSLSFIGIFSSVPLAHVEISKFFRTRDGRNSHDLEVLWFILGILFDGKYLALLTHPSTTFTPSARIVGWFDGIGELELTTRLVTPEEHIQAKPGKAPTPVQHPTGSQVCIADEIEGLELAATSVTTPEEIPTPHSCIPQMPVSLNSDDFAGLQELEKWELAHFGTISTKASCEHIFLPTTPKLNSSDFETCQLEDIEDLDLALSPDESDEAFSIDISAPSSECGREGDQKQDKTGSITPTQVQGELLDTNAFEFLNDKEKVFREEEERLEEASNIFDQSISQLGDFSCEEDSEEDDGSRTITPTPSHGDPLDTDTFELPNHDEEIFREEEERLEEASKSPAQFRGELLDINDFEFPDDDNEIARQEEERFKEASKPRASTPCYLDRYLADDEAFVGYEKAEPTHQAPVIANGSHETRPHNSFEVLPIDFIPILDLKSYRPFGYRLYDERQHPWYREENGEKIYEDLQLYRCPNGTVVYWLEPHFDPKDPEPGWFAIWYTMRRKRELELESRTSLRRQGKWHPMQAARKARKAPHPLRQT
ncbi:hypothetical protein K402DRAFT_433085 [Aulographum hederae CBS 113979]|uniref:Uncharacterized protein n=1 Tax=Aulographum hederae CBS 113979 TaxID=1176131 RepID=A0A6G1GVR6_9PEZI|nr:hypothetical protein K402DRAFT_433085 [Aulographum hederae CBS 113979]